MPGKKKYGMGRKGSSIVELTLPSFELDDEGEPTTKHNVCRVRKPDPQALIAAGVLDEFDSLTRLTNLKIEEIAQGGDASPEGRLAAEASAARTIASSKDDLVAGMDLIDKIVEYIVVEPKVLRPVQRDQYGVPIARDGKPVPLKPDERDPDQLYTDDVELEDRMFILSYAVDGGKDLESFRGGSQAILAAMEDGAGLQSATQ